MLKQKSQNQTKQLSTNNSYFLVSTMWLVSSQLFILFYLLQQYFEVGNNIPILKMRKPGPGGIKWFAQGFIASNGGARLWTQPLWFQHWSS